MTANKRSDQIFQLSLTEIAFTITFILLLLLGYLVMRESAARKKAEAQLEGTQGVEAAEKMLAETTEKLNRELSGAGVGKPDEIVSKLVAEAKAAAERDRLTVRVKELEAQVSTLTEVRQRLDSLGKEAGQKELGNQVVSALALQAEVEKALEVASTALATTIPQIAASSPAKPAGKATSQPKKADEPAQPSSSPAAKVRKDTRDDVVRSIEVASALDRALRQAAAKPLPSGSEATAVAEIVRAAETARRLEGAGVRVEDVRKENSDLRGQVANLRNRLESRGGRDYPPCWADEAGKVEFLFAIELRSDVAVITRAWPDRREADAAQLPGVQAALSAPAPLGNFPAVVRPIFEWSRTRDPECRHYVQLRSSISDAVQSDRARLMVENYFYKVEARR